MVAENIISQARTWLRQHSPFLDFVLEQMELRPTTALPTASVLFVQGRFVLEYNLTYLASLPPEQQVAVLEHELRHILHHHLERRGDRDLVRWNLACDLAINGDIPHLPTNALRPPRDLVGKTAEEIYERLPAQPVSSVAGLCQGALAASDQERLDGAFRSLLDAAQHKFDVTQISTAPVPQVSGTPGVDEGLHTPQGGLGIAWADVLTRYSQPRGKRRTLVRPDRRGFSPWGKQRERLPRVVAVIDTSGSISAVLGSAFLAELQRLRASCSSLTVIMADATVQAVLPFEELPEKSFVGRGETNFAPAIAYVNTHLADHDLLVYLTDGHGVLPSVDAVVPLLWIITANREFPGRPAVFALRRSPTPLHRQGL